MPGEGPRPDIFVVGDAKCGTTSLYHLFDRAPRIGTTRRKEFHFFSAPELVKRVAGPGDARIPRDIVQDEAAYLAAFAGLGAADAIVDVSPSYLRNSAAADRIAAFAPAARIIVTLREPAAKVFSQYVHLWAEGRETLSFAAAFEASAERRAAGFSDMFDYEGGGFYAGALEHYLDRFGPDRVHVVLFEDLVSAPDGEIARLGRFLGLDLPAGPLPHANAGGRLKSPFLAALLANETLLALRRVLLPPAIRMAASRALRRGVGMEKPLLEPAMAARLRTHFAADGAALAGLIGRPTGWPTT